MIGIDPRLDLAPLAPLVELLAERIVDKWLEKTDTRMIPQSVSPLGPRKHRDAVKRRIRNDEGGAFIRGRAHLLTREALAEEQRRNRPPEPDAPAAPPSPATPSPPTTQSPDAAAYARDLLSRMRELRSKK